jgi:hypothetical protein
LAHEREQPVLELHELGAEVASSTNASGRRTAIVGTGA